MKQAYSKLLAIIMKTRYFSQGTVPLILFFFSRPRPWTRRNANQEEKKAKQQIRLSTQQKAEALKVQRISYFKKKNSCEDARCAHSCRSNWRFPSKCLLRERWINMNIVLPVSQELILWCPLPPYIELFCKISLMVCSVRIFLREQTLNIPPSCVKAAVLDYENRGGLERVTEAKRRMKWSLEIQDGG